MEEKKEKNYAPKFKSGPANEEKIKFNPNGKYNMKFIDWTNEWEAVYDYMNDPEASENPCMLDEEIFEEIVVSFLCNYSVKILDNITK